MTEKCTRGGRGRELGFGCSSDAPEGFALRSSTTDARLVYWIVRNESSCQSVCEGMSSLSVQQMQLPYAGCNSFLEQKSKSSATTLGTGRSTGRSFLQHVCVHPQSHDTHHRLLQYNALLRRAHQIEMNVALKDQDRCKLSYGFSLLMPYSTYDLFA
ncbi:unnamed protein product [Sphagnum jensenii]|uniref:Uncharacterized protein n=1 Tax=Sphagnum jensenii TaxID=128206 RepID=A0ABP1ARE5_9BRYO